MTEFEEWCEREGYAECDDAIEAARDAWNAALDLAVAMVQLLDADDDMNMASLVIQECKDQS